MARNWIATEEHGEEVDVTLMEVPSESLEAELVEVEGQDKDIEQMSVDGQDLAADTDTIEELAENAEESLEEDGMDETAARATEIAAESLCNRWGIRSSKRVGLEAFGNADSRRNATMIAVEDLKEKAKEMWRQFVAWVREMISKARDQFSKLTNAGKALRKRADKLDSRLGNGLGTQKKDKVSGGFMKQLVIDEKFDYEGCLKFSNDAPNGVTALGKAIIAVYDKNKDMFRGEAGSLTAPGSLGAQFGKKTSKKLNVPQGAESITASALPGNSYLVSYVKDGVSHTRFEVAPLKEAKDAPTLNAAKCSDGVKALYKVADSLESRLKGFETANKTLQNLIGEMEKASDGFNEAKGEERQKKRAGFQKARAAVQTHKAAERAATYALKTAGTGIQGYISASIGAHEKA